MIGKPQTYSLSISHIDYSESKDVIMMYCDMTGGVVDADQMFVA